MLEDSFGRRFSYLRLSVTDACNFRCRYCLPNGFRANGPSNFLSVDEISRLAATFVRIGTRKVRLTGGEPTLRSDLPDIVRALRAAGVQRVAVSTNGWSLSEQPSGSAIGATTGVTAKALIEAGVSAFNISIDSLNAERFASRTGKTILPEILAGLDSALALGARVKINAVLMRTAFSEDLALFMDYVRTRPVSVRFIELMPTHDNVAFFEAEHMKASGVRESLIRGGWEALERAEDDGPAFEYASDGFAGRLGFVAPYAPSFCDNCNRLRVTSRGGLRLCLFGDEDYPIRHFLQEGASPAEFEAHLRSVVFGSKKVSHFLEQGHIGNNRSFSVMGG